MNRHLAKVGKRDCSLTGRDLAKPAKGGAIIEDDWLEARGKKGDYKQQIEQKLISCSSSI